MEKYDFDCIVVGAGFAGISALYTLQKQGLKVRVFESGDGIGGTWHFNRYPGARCDTHSMEYSFQFSEELQQDWDWSEKYATQPEILRYLNHTVDKFNLRGDIQLSTRIIDLKWDDTETIWRAKTNHNAQISARYCIMATGCLSIPNNPFKKDISTFLGDIYHTSRWPKVDPDFTGKTVGVIGTGSSALQCIPLIAEKAESLFVFQRTANYSVPARNTSLDANFVSDIKSRYQEFRQENYKQGFGIALPLNDVSALDVSESERDKEFESRWKAGGLGFVASFNDLIFDMDSNIHAQNFLRKKIRDIVKNKETADLLSPKTPVSCKRLCVDTGYYATYNRSNVTLVDINSNPITDLRPDGIVMGDKIQELDSLIIATGFDAMTGSIMNINIRGRNGVSIQEKWANGPATYLGLATSDFPNLFMITGPGSPSVLSNMVPSIEQHVNWVSQCINYLRNKNYNRIEAEQNAENAWMDEVLKISNASIYPHCQSWYLGSNIEGKKQVFTAYLGVPGYIAECEKVVKEQYSGFKLSNS